MAHVVAAADAVKLFKGVTVQTAERVKVKGDDGKVREAFKTADVALKAEHVMTAVQHDGAVVITTIDGQRHRADGVVKADKAADK